MTNPTADADQAPSPLVHKVNGYTIVWDAWTKRWDISRRGNHVGSGYRDLADAVRRAQR